jgi:hypothetical protein
MITLHRPVTSANPQQVTQPQGSEPHRAPAGAAGPTRRGARLLPQIDPVYYYGRFVWYLCFPIARVSEWLVGLGIRKVTPRVSSGIDAQVASVESLPGR